MSKRPPSRYRLTPPSLARPSPLADPDFEKKLALVPDAPGRAKASKPQSGDFPPAKGATSAPPPGANTTPDPKLPLFDSQAVAAASRKAPRLDNWKDQNPAFFKPLGSTLRRLKTKLKAKQPRKLGAANLRVIEAAVDIMADRSDTPIAYQHTVLCQTCLPYRDPGADVLNWDRDNGFVSLSMSAGRAFHPSRKWIQLGLPFGPKPRQILAYLNTEAILRQHQEIDVERSLTSFVKAMHFDETGRNFRTVKEQIARLAAADFRLGLTTSDTSADTHKGTIIQSFNLWCEKDDRQRVLWPRTIVLGDTYFQSLLSHAVPLDARAIAALGHSAMALDIYAWLAQRLHRIHPSAPVHITWSSLQRQFGEGFTRLRKFREKFLIAARAVKAVYPDAMLAADAKGLQLANSPPPIAKRSVQALLPNAGAK